MKAIARRKRLIKQRTHANYYPGIAAKITGGCYKRKTTGSLVGESTRLPVEFTEWSGLRQNHRRCAERHWQFCVVFEGHILPGFLFCQNRLQQFVVQRVTRFVRRECADNVVTTHKQVTDRIQHFVANKFVFKAQTVFVQYAIIVNNDGTIEAAAQAQAAGPLIRTNFLAQFSSSMPASSNR